MSSCDVPWPFACFETICKGAAGHKVSVAKFTFAIKSVQLVAGDLQFVLM